MKKSTFTEEQIAQALHQVELGTRRGRLSQAGYKRADLLPLKEEICRHGRCRAASITAAGRREPYAQAAGCGLDPRHVHAPGGHPKKAVKPTQKCELVQVLRVGYTVSERREGSTMNIDRSSYRYRSTAKD